jgi:hypothetical protein
MQTLFNYNPGYPSEYLGIPPDTLLAQKCRISAKPMAYIDVDEKDIN